MEAFNTELDVRLGYTVAKDSDGQVSDVSFFSMTISQQVVGDGRRLALGDSGSPSLLIDVRKVVTLHQVARQPKIVKWTKDRITASVDGFFANGTAVEAFVRGLHAIAGEAVFLEIETVTHVLHNQVGGGEKLEKEHIEKLEKEHIGTQTDFKLWGAVGLSVGVVTILGIMCRRQAKIYTDFRQRRGGDDPLSSLRTEDFANNPFWAGDTEEYLHAPVRRPSQDHPVRNIEDSTLDSSLSSFLDSSRVSMSSRSSSTRPWPSLSRSLQSSLSVSNRTPVRSLSLHSSLSGSRHSLSGSRNSPSRLSPSAPFPLLSSGSFAHNGNFETVLDATLEDDEGDERNALPPWNRAPSPSPWDRVPSPVVPQGLLPGHGHMLLRDMSALSATAEESVQGSFATQLTSTSLTSWSTDDGDANSVVGRGAPWAGEEQFSSTWPKEEQDNYPQMQYG